MGVRNWPVNKSPNYICHGCCQPAAEDGNLHVLHRGMAPEHILLGDLFYCGQLRRFLCYPSSLVRDHGIFLVKNFFNRVLVLQYSIPRWPSIMDCNKICCFMQVKLLLLCWCSHCPLLPSSSFSCFCLGHLSFYPLYFSTLETTGLPLLKAEPAFWEQWTVPAKSCGS